MDRIKPSTRHKTPTPCLSRLEDASRFGIIYESSSVTEDGVARTTHSLKMKTMSRLPSSRFEQQVDSMLSGK